MAAVVGVAGVILTAAVAILGGPVYQRAKTLGITRTKFENLHGSEFKLILNTVACEDLHHDRVSGQLYTSCQVSITHPFVSKADSTRVTNRSDQHGFHHW